MDWFVDLVAPRSWADAGAKAVAWLLLILGVDRGVATLLGVEFERPWLDAAQTVTVSLPFTALAFSLLLHQRRLQGRLATLATTDVLTGLPNRRDFMARARRAVEGGGTGALLLLDADHFKRINDAHGHAAGDACLQAVAGRLRGALRPGDLVGRLGGEEFALFLPGATRAEALAAGARLCAPLAVNAASPALTVTLSGGATLTRDAAPLDRLLADADRALYAAKAQGRARVVAWPPEEVVRAA